MVLKLVDIQLLCLEPIIMLQTVRPDISPVPDFNIKFCLHPYLF